MYVCLCVCVCMYVWMDGWMDAWMHACMHVCMYGPVSRVPESVSLGDHTIGGARDPESGRMYMYMYIVVRIFHVSSCMHILCI